MSAVSSDADLNVSSACHFKLRLVSIKLRWPGNVNLSFACVEGESLLMSGPRSLARRERGLGRLGVCQNLE